MKNNLFRIQDQFDDYDKVELFISNPTSNRIIFEINKLNYNLEVNQSKIIDVQIKTVTIKSNCYHCDHIYLNIRKFPDVHHA